MQISRLRAETEADHRAVEASISLMSDPLRKEDYLATLERMYGFVLAWEQLAESTAPPELLTFVQERARRSLLEGDIRRLQGHLPAGSAQLPHLASRSELLGALYVMEGSRLGGQFIARHVSAALGLAEEAGTSYFRGFGDLTGSHWKQLLRVLETEIPEEEAELTIKAAKSMFQAFGDWMRAEDHPPEQASPIDLRESCDA